MELFSSTSCYIDKSVQVKPSGCVKKKKKPLHNIQLVSFCYKWYSYETKKMKHFWNGKRLNTLEYLLRSNFLDL